MEATPSEKTQGLINNTMFSVTQSIDKWTAFLRTSAKMYKQSLNAQLSIHASKPTATACADYQTWRKLGREATNSTKAVKTINKSGRLQYLFDVSDTEQKGNSKMPWIWSAENNHQAINDMINRQYGASEATLEDNIIEMAIKATASFPQNTFGRVATASIAYILLERCGLSGETVVQTSAFDELEKLSDREKDYLVRLTTDISGDLLRQIESTVKLAEKNYRNRGEFLNGQQQSESADRNVPGRDKIRQVSGNAGRTGVVSGHNNGGRDDLHSGREVQQVSVLPDRRESEERGHNRRDEAESSERDLRGGTEPGGRGRTAVLGGRGGRESVPSERNVRNSQTGISSEQQTGTLRTDESGQYPGGTPDSNQQESGRIRGGNGEHLGETRQNGRTIESDRPDGMDTPNEQLQNVSTGSSIRDDSLHLNENENSDEKKAEEEKPSAFSLPDDRLMDSLWKVVNGSDVPFGYTTDGKAMFNGQELSDSDISKLTENIESNIRIYNTMIDIYNENISIGKSIVYNQHMLKETTIGRDEYVKNTEKLFSFLKEVQSEKEKQQTEDKPKVEKKQQMEEKPQSKATIGFKKFGAKSKFRKNIEALKTLKQLEAENRPATESEKNVLSAYVGWGGISQAFDPNNADWAKEYKELKELLTESEYESAKSSTLNAHYTSPEVVEAMYQALENMGFKGGKILEPSMGIGNFFGGMPDEIKKNSQLFGVELDDITGRIAQKIYPDANIQVKGFEKAEFPDDFFDVAIGNVPFGDFGVADKKYDKENFRIHDYFFAKALDKVRPNGVVAFVTSQGTLDKQNDKVRKHLAERAELLGAVRLPSTAFKGNAGTEVTTDIVFLKKREKPLELTPETTPDWTEIAENQDGIKLNKYFVDNPQMILGKMVNVNKLYGHGTSCIADGIESLKERLKKVIELLKGKMASAYSSLKEKVQPVQSEPAENAEKVVIQSIQAIQPDEDIKNYSFGLINDEIYFKVGSNLVKQDFSESDANRVKGMIELRTQAREIIQMQLNDCTDEELTAKQADFGKSYDDFTKKYGLLNDKKNSKLFKEDDSYYLLASLEILNEKGKLDRKADLFTKRTIRPAKAIEKVGTAVEALVVSISEKACVDIDFMKNLTGLSEEKLISDLSGQIFENPESNKWETADEYLSGNVVKKLEIAKKQTDTRFQANVKALEAVQPTPLTSAEIDIKLGATWIPQDYIREFIHEIMKTPQQFKRDIQVDYSEINSEWNISEKSLDKSATATSVFGTKRKNGYQIIEDTLNLRDCKVYDTVDTPDGKKKSVLNEKETLLVQEKQRELKQAFSEWIFKDAGRREKLVDIYNSKFNNSRPREYDGSHINFVGMNPEITLKDHQKNAVARTLYGGNTLLAHQVGAGKTFEMIASAMESKRLGLCSKSLIAVPNHLTEQIGVDFLRLYPSAKILVATKDDFKKENRKKFLARIATGNYDAIIIGHSQLSKIPLSLDRQAKMLKDEIAKITDGIEKMKLHSGKKFTVKQFEKTKKGLETKLQKLLDTPKDDVVTFEEMGVDKLFVDEAHLFKNLFVATKMSNVSGISNSNSQRAMDLYMKCQYLDEITGGKGIVFATGTPISNSMAEMYTMQRYLQSSKLKELGLENFDAWASTFGETVTSMELSPEGKYRSKTRFAKFFNLPELMNIFKDCADIKTADQLQLPVPEHQIHNICVPPTETQKKLVKTLSERAEKVRKGTVAPTEDNLLKITGDGRKTGLDQRLVNPELPDEKGSKVNVCIDNVYDIWDRTKEKKSAQLIFCDLGTPKNSSAKKVKSEQSEEIIDMDEARNSDIKFDVYADIKKKLVARGVPENEIAFIHDAKTEKQKEQLFEKVRKGSVRVLIGSTAKCGAGTNIQDKLIAMHDLDCPWRPSDLEQRMGRIVRRGNENPEVDIYRYVTDSTFDAFLYQTVENKQKFISQIMTSKSPARSCQDCDEAVLTYAEIKALCAGNPLIKKKMDLEVDISRLQLLKSGYIGQLRTLEDDIRKNIPFDMDMTKRRISNLKADISALKNFSSDGEFEITINDKKYTDKSEANEAIKNAGINLQAEYKGFKITADFDFAMNIILKVSGNGNYRTQLGTNNVLKLDNLLENLPKAVEEAEQKLQSLQVKLEETKVAFEKPFPQERELAEKMEELRKTDKALSANAKPVAFENPKYRKVSMEEYEAVKALAKAENLPVKAKKTENEIIIAFREKDTPKIEQAMKMAVSSKIRR